MMYRPGNGVNHSTTISIRPSPRVESMYASAPTAERAALQLPPRRALPDGFKKPTISRAEGGQLQAPVGRLRWLVVERTEQSHIVSS
jgi:hypothetical protein